MRVNALYLAIFTILLIISPVSATKVDFNVGVVGEGVFHPGDEVPMTVMIQPAVEYEGVVNENTSDMIPLFTMAKNVRVEMDSVYNIMEVRNVGEQVLGDVPSGVVARTVFNVKILGREGKHSIPLRIKYTKVEYNYATETLSYVDETITKYIKIEIKKKDYDFSVVDVKSNLIVGREGIVEVKIKNTGLKDMDSAVIILNATPPLTPSPKGFSNYIGTFKSGEIKTARFKVYVLEGALEQMYSAKLVLNFKTPSGYPLTLVEVCGVQVKKEDIFNLTVLESLVTSPKAVRQSFATTQQSFATTQRSTPSIPVSNLPPQLKIMSSIRPPQSNQMIQILSSRGYIVVRIEAKENITSAVASLYFNTPQIQAENSPYVGNLFKDGSKDVMFYIRNSAPPGSYSGYVILSYKNELGDDEVSKKLTITLDVESTPALEIEKVVTRNLGPGMVGEIAIKLKNAVGAKKANLYLIAQDSSLTPVSSSAYIDDFSKMAKFRLRASDEAISGLHTMYLLERFSTDKAEDIVSIAELPVFIESKSAHFQLISVESVNLYPDSSGYIVAKFRNAGSMEVYNTVVELTVSSPLSVSGGSVIGGMIGQSQPGTYFIGTMKPGDEAVAKFRVDIDKDAGVGNYPLSFRISYYDEEGYSYSTNSIVASAEVKEKPAITPLLAGAILLALVALVVAGRIVRKKRKESKSKDGR